MTFFPEMQPEPVAIPQKTLFMAVQSLGWAPQNGAVPTTWQFWDGATPRRGDFENEAPEKGVNVEAALHAWFGNGIDFPSFGLCLADQI